MARLVEREYDVPRPVESELAQSGFNDNYWVRAGPHRASSVVRICRRGSYWLIDEASYRFELEWLLYVHGRGAPVAAPLPRRDGDLLGTVDAPEGSRYVARFAFAEGTFVELTPAGAHAVGVAHARLCSRVPVDPPPPDRGLGVHAARAGGADRAIPGGDRPGSPRRRAPASRDGRSCLARVRPHPAGRPYLGRARRRLPSREPGVRAGRTRDADRLRALRLGAYAYDCATLRWSLRGSGDEEHALWAAYLDGYGTVRRLTDEEALSIPWLAAARHIWLMGAHTTYAADAGTASLGPAYWNHRFDSLRDLVHAADAAG